MYSLIQNGVENHTFCIFTQDKAFQSPIRKLNFVSHFNIKFYPMIITTFNESVYYIKQEIL